jgi:hypothetical protein
MASSMWKPDRGRHRFEKPVERRVLVSDGLFELGSTPVLVAVTAGARAPRLEALIGIGSVEAADHVQEAKHAS